MFDNSSKTPLMSDPFDETKIIINTIIDKLEQNYTLLPNDHFNSQIDRIEKDIKLLSSCITKIKDEQEKTRRNNTIRGLETRINNLKKQFLTRKTHTQIINPVEVNNSDTQKLLISNMVKEQDQQLDLISNSLGRLQNMAVSINDEVNRQNTMIDEITIKVDEVNDNMNSNTSKIKRLNKLLRKNNCCKYGLILGLLVSLAIVIIIVAL